MEERILEERILEYLKNKEKNITTLDISEDLQIQLQDVNSIMQSFEAQNKVVLTITKENINVLTDEAKYYQKLNKSPENIIFEIICERDEGRCLKSELKELLLKKNIEKNFVDSIIKNGLSICCKNKWLKMTKNDNDDIVINTLDCEIEDTLIESINRLEKNDIKELKKRKLIKRVNHNYYTISKTEEFSNEKKICQLTSDMLKEEEEEKNSNVKFKKYKFIPGQGTQEYGSLHPLLKMKREFKNIFLCMGFEEMKTNNFVESSFWNFDALFQPQKHPARDAHDTFFLKNPERTAISKYVDNEVIKNVKKVHESGGYGSIGYNYTWNIEEAEKNILRTHTTAVSSRYLYNLAQEYKKNGFFTPKKYFSIDRVFRNETPDSTHLCEFQQIEGMVIDKGLSLGDMLGLFEDFFKGIGIGNLVFKPAYNPYTEPSAEIFTKVGSKMLEVGNSGIFRPEMLKPLGFPDDVTVLAWGLSLERPTMIKYGITNIRDLVGHKVDVKMIKKNPLVMF